MYVNVVVSDVGDDGVWIECVCVIGIVSVCIVECVYVVNGVTMSVYGNDMECMCIEWVKVEWNECEGVCVW